MTSDLPPVAVLADDRAAGNLIGDVAAVVHGRTRPAAGADLPPPSWYGHMVQLGLSGRAIEIAGRNLLPSRRAQAYVAVSSALAAVGLPERAAAIAGWAALEADDVNDPWVRAECQVEACGALAVAGVGVVAGFGTALAQAQRITEGAARVRALSGIARTAAATDSRDHAVAIAQEAASLADTVGFPGRRPDALAVAVGALVATGLCDAGRELASGIGDPWARAEAFVCVAAGPPIPIPAADPPAGEDAGALREALSAARSVSNSAWRAEAQAAVVAAMCRLGDPDRALATAETIADPVWRAEALLAVAAADRTGREAAVSLLDRATRLGRSVGYPWWQTGRLARVLARLLTAAPGDQSLLEPSRTARILVGVARVLGARPPGGGTRAALSAVLDALAAADLTDLLATDLLASCTCAYPECAVELRALAAGAGA